MWEKYPKYNLGTSGFRVKKDNEIFKFGCFLNFDDFTSSLCRVPQKYALKCVLHIQPILTIDQITVFWHCRFHSCRRLINSLLFVKRNFHLPGITFIISYSTLYLQSTTTCSPISVFSQDTHCAECGDYMRHVFCFVANGLSTAGALVVLLLHCIDGLRGRRYYIVLGVLKNVIA